MKIMFGGRFACAASAKGTKANKSRLVMGISVSIRLRQQDAQHGNFRGGAIAIQLRKSSELWAADREGAEGRRKFVLGGVTESSK